MDSVSGTRQPHHAPHWPAIISGTAVVVTGVVTVAEQEALIPAPPSIAAAPDRRRMGAKMDRVLAALQRKLARESDDALHRGMHFPTRWDPFFKDYMTLEGVYRYPGKHFDFHKRQLTVSPTD